jgi:GNAT superfamily N-acetyltransferase
MHRLEFRPATEEEQRIALAALDDHTLDTDGVAMNAVPFSVLAYVGDELAGGVVGKIFWNWLYADLLWVDKKFRGTGIGTDLMKQAESKANEKNLTGIYLWTQSWQAPDFYKKLGYQEFTELKNFPPGHSRIGLVKYL